jgi:hypothetical protein
MPAVGGHILVDNKEELTVTSRISLMPNGRNSQGEF